MDDANNCFFAESQTQHKKILFYISLGLEVDILFNFVR